MRVDNALLCPSNLFSCLSIQFTVFILSCGLRVMKI